MRLPALAPRRCLLSALQSTSPKADLARQIDVAVHLTDVNTTSPKTCDSAVSSNSDSAASGLHQSLPSGSWVAAKLRASSSVLAATTATCRPALSLYSRRVSRPANTP